MLYLFVHTIRPKYLTKCVYYSHQLETTHWDHPKMIELMSSLADLNEVRFSAYRTAMKLRTVQKRLCREYFRILSDQSFLYCCLVSTMFSLTIVIFSINHILHTVRMTLDIILLNIFNACLASSNRYYKNENLYEIDEYFIYCSFFIISVDMLSLSTALEQFDSHGLRAQNDKLIDIPDMVTVLTSLYEVIAADNPAQVSVPLCIDLAINWLLNVYDRYVL